MGFKQFSLRIITRTILAVMSLLFLVFFISQPGYHAASMLLAILVVSQLYELIRYVNKTNSELVRFFDAARHADYSQRFDLSKLGTGFDELGQAFGDILGRLQQASNQKEESLRHLKAVVEHVPVPLISLVSSAKCTDEKSADEKGANQKLTLWNNSARRLFGTHSVTKLSDLDQFHTDCVQTRFSHRLAALIPGERLLVTMKIDDTPHQLSIAATAITIGQQQELLISLQDIQSELDTAQLSAWQDLVRVLTHEIMNSITPVASLAKTAVDLVDDVAEQVASQPALVAELSDITDAVNTVARRSDGLMQFVTSYRRLTRLPPPNKQPITIVNLFENVERLACQHWPSKSIAYQFSASPPSLTLNADNDMLEQVMINLLQNAEHAVAGVSQANITINASLNNRGRVIIEVSDNGSGIDQAVAEKIFVPFFTTKRDGSGVGLALTRQIMLAHGGFISLANKTSNSDEIAQTKRQTELQTKQHGSVFRLTF